MSENLRNPAGETLHLPFGLTPSDPTHPYTRIYTSMEDAGFPLRLTPEGNSLRVLVPVGRFDEVHAIHEGVLITLRDGVARTESEVEELIRDGIQRELMKLENA